ncbi:hypothetical protein ACWFRM_21220 [Streptomyces sp. NPDC055144]
MNVRHTLSAVAITTGLVLTVAGCGGGDDKGSENPKPSSSSSKSSGRDAKESAPAESKSLAEVKSNGITVTVNSVTRDQGGFLNITGTVTNGGSGIWVASEWKSDETELQVNGGSLAGASVVDQAGKKKYLVLRDTQGRCLCTKFEGGINQGQTVDWFAQFPAPPEGTTKVQLQVPTMPPAPVEISEGE